MTEVYDRLLDMQDLSYRDFSAKLLPTVSRECILGVRVPLLRRYAKELAQTAQAEAFMRELPHKYLEENHLHSFLIGQMRDVNQCYAALDAFLPYVDNWAVCDSLRPRVLAHDRARLFEKIQEYLQSEHPYTVRFGIEMLMLYYLDEHFDPAHLALVATVQSGEYYVNMMIAWYFATALAGQWEATLPYLQGRRLPAWVHAKTIQKAVESYRITPEQRAVLRALR